MLRKSLFFGLTLVLVVALVGLTLRGRRLEKQQASQSVEVVQPSRSTSTRIWTPQDLEIVQLKIRLEQGKGTAGRIQSRIARHEIEIRNNGKVPYGRIQLSFDYLGRNGKLLTTRTQSISRTILPGTDLKLTDVGFDGLPSSTADFRVTIVYADIGNEPLSQD